MSLISLNNLQKKIPYTPLVTIISLNYSFRENAYSKRQHTEARCLYVCHYTP